MRPRLRITPCLFATILGLWLALGSFLPAALAQQRKATLVTGDKDFSQVETEVKIFWTTEG